MLTRAEAAALASVHINTIRNWERSGRLRSYAAPGSGKILIRSEDLTALLVERDAKGQAPIADADVQMLNTWARRLVSDLERALAVAKGLEEKMQPSRSGSRQRRSGAA